MLPEFGAQGWPDPQAIPGLHLPWAKLGQHNQEMSITALLTAQRLLALPERLAAASTVDRPSHSSATVDGQSWRDSAEDGNVLD